MKQSHLWDPFDLPHHFLQPAMFRFGYIISPKADLVWFLGLPFLAIAFALACQQWLPAVAVAAVAIWVTVPHHFVTWLRTYGLPEDWLRFKDRLIIGPLIIFTMTLGGLAWAPLSLLLVAYMWDHQHSIMQQHGFGRIYDYKAKAGEPSTGRLDLALNWVLYLNLLITAPIFARFWIRELHRFALPISAEAVRQIQMSSLIATGLFLCFYSLAVLKSVRRGYPINPVKYIFIGASFFLWYYVAWRSDSMLVQKIAHAIMHGVQYIVIVYVYLARKEHQPGSAPRWLATMVQPRNLWMFLLACLGYAVLFQIVTRQPLEEFGFGIVNFTSQYKAIPEHNLEAMSRSSGYDLFAAMILQSAALVHYYFDSFIWKVRDTKTQEGL